MNLLISSVTEVIVMLIGLIAFYYAFKNYFSESIIPSAIAGKPWVNRLIHKSCEALKT